MANLMIIDLADGAFKKISGGSESGETEETGYWSAYTKYAATEYLDNTKVKLILLDDKDGQPLKGAGWTFTLYYTDAKGNEYTDEYTITFPGVDSFNTDIAASFESAGLSGVTCEMGDDYAILDISGLTNVKGDIAYEGFYGDKNNDLAWTLGKTDVADLDPQYFYLWYDLAATEK